MLKNFNLWEEISCDTVEADCDFEEQHIFRSVCEFVFTDQDLCLLFRKVHKYWNIYF